jgi:chromate transporter
MTLGASAVAMITPGPVVITVAFIGFLVAGFGGAALAAIGIFLPVYVPVLLISPWFKRHRESAQLRGFVQGATAAATGAITASVVILGQRAIYDVPTALVGLVDRHGSIAEKGIGSGKVLGHEAIPGEANARRAGAAVGDAVEREGGGADADARPHPVEG